MRPWDFATVVLGLGSALIVSACGLTKPNVTPPVQAVLSNPFPNGAIVIAGWGDESAKQQLGRGIQGDHLNMSAACTAMRQGDTWQSVEGGNLPQESIRSIDMNEVYWNIEKAGAKGGVTAKLFEVEGISAELKVGGGTAGGYFYRVTISRAHILDLPLSESAAVATPPTCGDLACGYDYAAEILCGELIFQAATSNAFDANGGIKVDAWNLEIGGALKAEYAASKEVKRSGCFIAVPRPYWELGQGKFCDDPYQEGLRRGKECSAIDMCRQPCLTRQMRLVKDRKWDEEGLGLFLDGFERGFDKYSPLAFRQSCRPGENIQRQM